MLTLYSFFRSSAAWRVRIALAIKGLDYTLKPRNFRTKAHQATDYLAIHPQGLVPALVDYDRVVTQSSAIIEYLDETYPEPPLLPALPLGRALVRAIAATIACDALDAFRLATPELQPDAV